MLLIIFGHSGLLTTDFVTGERTVLWRWLYHFHVYVFLILPFIYGYKQTEEGDKKTLRSDGKFYVDIQRFKTDIKHNLIKIGIPYCWFFALSALIFVTVAGGDFNPKGMLYAFMFGNQTLMDKYIGFNFIWFLPAILALIIIKSLWYNSSPAIRGCMLTVSIALWLLAIFKVLPQNTAGLYVPFSISQAFYFLLLGVTARYLIEKVPVKKTLLCAALVFAGITLMVFYQDRMRLPSVISYSDLYRLILPIATFVLLYGISNWLSKSRFLKLIGIYSFQVYLVHIYVINILQVLLLHYFPQSVGLGVVIYVLTLAISLGLAVAMVKVPFVNKVVFPKG